MKVNLGCGIKKENGYINIDVDPKCNPDVVGDFREMNYKDLDEVRATHVLEHFGRKEGIQVLKQWKDWLKPGGTLVVATPDVEGLCFLFEKDKKWITRALYGSQTSEYEFHKDGWYEDKFKKVLKELDFKIVKTIKRHSHANTPEIKIAAIKL